jgi:cyclohexadieny/prephenate dehydrogenase
VSEPFRKVALIGLGLLGSSLAHAIKRHLPGTSVAGYDASPSVRARAAELGLGEIADDPLAAVSGADLVILCVPVGAMGEAAAAVRGAVEPGAIVSDVGSSKQSVARAVADALPGATVIPAHPVAGTERSGPDAGFATLFHNRWCILTPPSGTDPHAVARLAAFWEALGANVETMDAGHHDLVLAVTSHLPHLIAYAIVGTASDLEGVTRSEVIKFSAGGFRDFTRIAASDPTMWRDVFLTNRDAVLEMLGRFSEDLTALQRAIRWGDGDALFQRFETSREVRRAVLDAGQDRDAVNFGRDGGGDPAPIRKPPA